MKKLLAASIALLVLLLSNPAAHAAGEYRLGVGERLRIDVYEWPDLSGEFSVGPPGTVFLSLIGEVVADGRTQVELADAISSALQKRANLPEPPSTTVEIVTYRPFFILGDVQNPGEFVFRPGLNVLQALSLAGGLYRAGALGSERLEREILTSLGALQLHELRIDERSARKARLEAEISGDETVTFPEALLERAEDPLIASILTNERMQLVLQRRSISSQQAAERDIQALLEAEIESLEAEGEAIGAQLASAEQELADVRSLVERGLAPAPRQLTLERLAASIAAERRAIDTAILRARQGIRQSQQRSENYVGDRRLIAIAELRETVTDIEEARRRITNTQQLMIEATGATPDLANQSLQDASALRYRIIRGSGDSVEIITATEMTPVQPGDTVEILRAFNQPGSRPRRPVATGSLTAPPLHEDRDLGLAWPGTSSSASSR